MFLKFEKFAGVHIFYRVETVCGQISAAEEPKLCYSCMMTQAETTVYPGVSNVIYYFVKFVFIELIHNFFLNSYF